jgi:hypothetical protein
MLVCLSIRDLGLESKSLDSSSIRHWLLQLKVMGKLQFSAPSVQNKP